MTSIPASIAPRRTEPSSCSVDARGITDTILVAADPHSMSSTTGRCGSTKLSPSDLGRLSREIFVLGCAVTTATDHAGALLPPARRVLAVCAHPDDESFGIGGIIGAYVATGAEVNLVCLTRGEASMLGADRSELAKVRTSELRDAARQLGITSLEICDHPDGRLSDVSLGELAVSIRPHTSGIDLVLVFDEGGITGHPDHIHATAAALIVADEIDVPVLAWTLPDAVATVLNDEFHAGFVGRPEHDIDVLTPVDRARQYAAMRCHGSQLTNNPVPDRRLALTGPNEALRWLRP